MGKFAREVGGVVLGVLIALGFGAIATEIGWRFEVSGARQAVRYEIVGNRNLARERSAVRSCVDRRLDELAAILAEASRTRRLPPVGAIHSPGRPGWSSVAWKSFQSAQTATHFPPKEFLALNNYYNWIDDYDRMTDSDAQAWQTLAMFVGPGRPLDATTEGELYAALSNARYSNARLGRSLDWFDGILARSGLPADYAKTDDAGTTTVPLRLICQPIGITIPKTYGQEVWLGQGRTMKARVPADK
ncbi:hypothetical protein [Sphingomonas sp. LT1P40]|uniref:hypothetical protein n=1 Tax=Alteristakelama amylovorans TaxID=3096166 RepID=UPI002FC79A1F